MGHFYPVALQLAGRPCVVIGGGSVAEEKVRGLLDAGARVTLIAPQVTPHLARLAEEGRIVWLPRTYRPGDLRGAFLAIAAAEDRTLNEAIWQEAEEQKVLLNAVDDSAHCHFIAPAIHRQGPVSVAVATEGKSPALAVHLRNRIAAMVGPEYGMLAEILGELRQEVAARLPSLERRRALWNAIVASDVVEQLRQGDTASAHRRVREMVERAASASEAATADSGAATAASGAASAACGAATPVFGTPTAASRAAGRPPPHENGGPPWISARGEAP